MANSKYDKFAVVETILKKGAPAEERVYKFDTLDHAEMRANDLAINFADRFPHYRVERGFLFARMYKNETDPIFAEQYEIKQL